MVCKLKLSEGGTLSNPEDALERLGWRDGEELILQIDGHAARLNRVPRDPVTGKTQQEMTPDERAAAFDRWVAEYGGSLKGRMTDVRRFRTYFPALQLNTAPGL